MPDVRYSCALVTGASAGLGAEFARQLAPHCAVLVLVARRSERLVELAGELEKANEGLRVMPLEADLTDPSARLQTVGHLLSKGLAPDLLVNNAGLGDYGEFVTSDWMKVESMLRLNVEALTHLTHALLPTMIEQGRGSILNVSSLASLLPMPDFAVYAATKAYVTSFSEALRIETQDHGIKVMALCPGPVHTEFGEVAGRGTDTDFGAREWFYVPKEQVVTEALEGLMEDRPRVYPGLRVAVAAVAISLVPIVVMRLVMGLRLRK
ncbi:SDR family NAD(P)-dependent oxidoreductase [Luteolibacter sp. Populi]|uniref:SDR family NAD(P)-dependent oxidoreductase n=1 Tax=Luteolibacter sp. Populi TaxID=3230487 RepID=UPI0034669A38